jgi:phosphatidylserine/phosphatidylglycerophosphate/cardiolipin synthase-like enzyme
MPTLQQLKDKWFIPMDGSAPDGVPCRRHTDDAGQYRLSVSTDGNTVTPLVDGQAYMKVWHDRLLALMTAPAAEFFNTCWRFEAVKTEGETVSTSDALDDVEAADGTGTVSTYVLACRNAPLLVYNLPSIDWLRLHGAWKSCLDNRFPAAGSNHQKFAVYKQSATAVSATLGSLDISKPRWDTRAHLPVDPDRHPWFRDKPTHDTGVSLEGPAVTDVEKTFRERWNDSTRTFGLEPPLPPQPLITSPISAPAAGGSHSVQVLRTYGITSTFFGYSWSPRGEFTAWASYLNAIKKATSYIYIEDQYFLPFDWPPCHTRSGLARDTDIVYQLGEAMKRGVRLAVVVPNNAEDALHTRQKFQRDIGVNHLLGIKLAGAAGDIVVAALKSGNTDVYVHSKLMVVDDELLLIGSVNVCQRSMSHDGELHVGVVDANNQLAKEYRKQLWAEHTGRPAADFDDPVAGYGTFKTDTAASFGHLTPYRVDPAAVYPPGTGTTAPPKGHPTVLRSLIDPYAGPPALR